MLSHNIHELATEKLKWVWSICTCIVVLALWWLFDVYLEASLPLLFFSILVFFIACIDAYSYIIPDRLLIIGAIIPVISLIRNVEFEPILSAISVIIIGGLVYYLSKRFWDKTAFGIGDIKLIAVIALFSGWEFLWILYFAIILGGLFALTGILFNKLKRSSKIPFAPFLFLAFVIHYLAPGLLHLCIR